VRAENVVGLLRQKLASLGREIASMRRARGARAHLMPPYHEIGLSYSPFQTQKPARAARVEPAHVGAWSGCRIGPSVSREAAMRAHADARMSLYGPTGGRKYLNAAERRRFMRAANRAGPETRLKMMSPLRQDG
jgi:hypothetical protein